MTKKIISIIGTTRITHHHIQAANKMGFKIHSISAARKNSKYLKKIANKYKINNYYYSWKNCIQESIKFNKEISFVVTAPTKNNKKILNYLLKNNSKILVEKPIFNNLNDFDLLKKNNRNIFVGYNRIFYKNIIFLKKKISKKYVNVICNIPENNRNDLISNSCHIVSILLFLFGDLILQKKIESKNFINVILKSSGAKISLFFNFKSSENFSIKIYDKERVYQLSPIEVLKIFDGIKVKNIKGLNFYEPKKVLQQIENFKNLKPGFYLQYMSFYKFIRTGKNDSDILFAKKVIKLIKKILQN